MQAAFEQNQRVTTTYEETTAYAKEWLIAQKAAGIASYQRVADEIGVARPYVSQLVNRNRALKETEHIKLLAWLEVNAPEQKPTTQPSEQHHVTVGPVCHPVNPEAQSISTKHAVSLPDGYFIGVDLAAEDEAYQTEIGLYPTTSFKKLMMWCKETYEARRIGTITGESGTGKTTVLKEFVKQTPGALYIDCWPTMKAGDLVDSISEALGIVNGGTIHKRLMRVLRTLQERPEVMLIFDESENLRNRGTRNFDMIRKLWDSANTPIILAGTQTLEAILTRGTGNENCTYLYRRITQCRPVGITEGETNDIMLNYHMDANAKKKLTALAMDRKHGGLGNFVEVLKIALRIAGGGQITGQIVDNAKQYKLLY